MNPYVIPKIIPSIRFGNSTIIKKGVSELVKKNNTELIVIVMISHTNKTIFL